MRPAELAIVCGLAAMTALAVATVPILWHPREPDRLMAFAEAWPERAIERPEPRPNVVPFKPPIAVPAIEPRLVPTISYKLVTEVPKTGLKVEREVNVEPPERKHDHCWPGRRVDHGRRWRCVYNRR